MAGGGRQAELLARKTYVKWVVPGTDESPDGPRWRIHLGSLADGLTIGSTPSGLQIGGRVTEVVISSDKWYLIPPVALTDRNAAAVSNFQTGVLVKLNYDLDLTGVETMDTKYPTFVGMPVPSNGERFYDIKPSIKVYAKADPSTLTFPATITIIVEELS